CAFVLVAGGLGERLGYSKIKVSLPTELTTGTCYLESYIKSILALQVRGTLKKRSGVCANMAILLSLQNASNKATGSDKKCQLVIMTSDDTHTGTVSLLKEHHYFGMSEDQVTLVKQEKVAALIDAEGHFAMASPYEIVTKPHGHGDVHQLLHSHGLVEKWAKEGKKYVVFFQDTNSPAFLVNGAALGASEKEGLAFNSITIPRKAGEAVGAIAKLKKEDGSAITCNVEYNQLEPLLKATVNPKGDVNDEATGFSPFPGNINQLIIRLKEYQEVLDKTSGLMPEFVNPKYADAEKMKFKAPTRLECMMQDLPKVLPTEAKVGFTQFDVRGSLRSLLLLWSHIAPSLRIGRTLL
ncbi:USP, partial [Symbiodinium sp. KB8]